MKPHEYNCKKYLTRNSLCYKKKSVKSTDFISDTDNLIIYWLEETFNLQISVWSILISHPIVLWNMKTQGSANMTHWFAIATAQVLVLGGRSLFSHYIVPTHQLNCHCGIKWWPLKHIFKIRNLYFVLYIFYSKCNTATCDSSFGSTSQMKFTNKNAEQSTWSLLSDTKLHQSQMFRRIKWILKEGLEKCTQNESTFV